MFGFVMGDTLRSNPRSLDRSLFVFAGCRPLYDGEEHFVHPRSGALILKVAGRKKLLQVSYK